MATTGSGPANKEQWCKLIRKSVASRLDVDQFESYARALLSKASLPKDELAAALISADAYPTPQLSVDPRYLLYIQRLVSGTIVPLSSFLTALLATDVQQNVLAGALPDVIREPVDTAILTALVLVTQGLTGYPSPRDGPGPLVILLGKWMDLVLAAGEGDGLDGLGLGGGVMGAAKKAVIAELILAIGENQHLNGWLKTNEIGKDRKAHFETTLPMFAQVFQTINPQLTVRLDALLPKKGDVNGNSLLGVGIGLDGLPDGGTPSRGGLYVFINSLLFARPLFDDDYLLHYLINRYKELGGQVALDLIVAAFDCIANASSRSESASTIALSRHFLVNKIPLLLLRFNMSTVEAQFVLTQALAKTSANSLDPNFNSTDAMMLDSPNDIKQEFLVACALHRIIEEQAVEIILGDRPLTAMAKRRYTQADLVTECSLNSDRLERLISEIEELDGNSGAIVGAVVEMLQQMCQDRDTYSLYSMCKNMITTPTTIDLLLLYAKPVAILEPLCIVLDNWPWDDDQGEYEPVYKEFGYTLLLVITIYFRHNLSFRDLGNIASTSFVPTFIRQCHKDFTPDELMRSGGDRQAKLGGWIKALYEGDGITDEVMQSSKPQEYYSLVPTLIAQTVEACDRGILDTDTLRGGLEYFQLSSLIASEVSIIFWLTDYIWATQSDISNAIKILHILITNAPSEVTQTHKTILAICSHNLERVLKDLPRNDSTHQQADQILKHLAPYRDFQRTGLPSSTELDAWSKQPNGGILTALKHSVQGVIMWSATPDLSLQPASYTPRLLYAASRLLGVKEVVKTLVDEVLSISNLQTGVVEGVSEIAIDVVASMICAPQPDDWRLKVAELTGKKEDISTLTGFVSLVDALRYLEDDMKLSVEDQGRGEIVVRLSRRVDSMLTTVNLELAVATVAGATVVVDDLTTDVLGLDVMGDGADMFSGMQDGGVDLLTADEIMTGM